MSQLNPEDYNDKNYPIEPIWALKNSIASLVFTPLAVTFILFSTRNLNSTSINTPIDNLIFLLYPFYFFIIIPFYFFSNIIRRATYHYQFEEKYLNLKQGVVSKQNRQLPFGVIQNILITQGPLDRLFGLSTLTIQNATQSSFTDQKAQAANTAGFFGNTINIPGLSKENAEEIKEILLKKIKESPIVELGM